MTQTPIKILAVNPNTSVEVTDRYLAAARAAAPEGVVIDGVTGRFGTDIVTNEAENIIAGHSALDLAARHAAGYDAVILAISFDTALYALQGVLPVPVTGITEAALHSAGAGGRSIGVVMYGAVSAPVYARLFRLMGTEITATEIVEIASKQDYLDEVGRDGMVRDAIERLARKGCDTAVICGAAMTGMAARIQPNAALPLYDGTQAVPLTLKRINKHIKSNQPNPVGKYSNISDNIKKLLNGNLMET